MHIVDIEELFHEVRFSPPEVRLNLNARSAFASRIRFVEIDCARLRSLKKKKMNRNTTMEKE